MSPVIPFDIITVIIDIVGESKDTDLLKELALVSHSFLQICSKHLFATVELHDTVPRHYLAASNKGFVKLLKSRPDVVNYIRKLTYKMGNDSHYQSLQLPPTHPNYRSDDDSHLLSLIPPNFLQTIPHLNSLTIASAGDWKTLDSSLKSSLLHLMQRPTINHIELSFIRNFPLSSLTSSVNLHRLYISHLFDSHHDGEDGSFENIHSEMILRELHTSESSLPTTKLLHAKTQDGRPAFNFTNLRRLSISFTLFEDEWIIRHLLQNAKLLEKLHLSVDFRRSVVGLLSLSARTLKVLDLTLFLYRFSFPPLSGLCEELETMAGHNMLESLSFEIKVDSHETEDFIGSVIQKVEEVLVNPGWSNLRQVSFKVFCLTWADKAKLEALRSLPDKYLSHLSKLESVAFNYSADIFKSTY